MKIPNELLQKIQARKFKGLKQWNLIITPSNKVIFQWLPPFKGLGKKGWI